MQAAIISTGNELIIGTTLDTNSHWLINQLTSRDVEVMFDLTVGDDQAKIVWALGQAVAQVPLVVITGGLGPTDDDRTRFALAELAGVKLVEHAESVRRIENFFRARHRVMNERNKVQARMPQGAEALDNPAGTAPGIKIAIGGTTVFALPGVPREMQQMYGLHVLPWVEQQVRATTHRRWLHCIGVGESDLVHRLNDLVSAHPTVVFGTTAQEGIISINLADKDKAAVDSLERTIRERLGPVVFGRANETLAGVVGDLLRSRRETLATAESCTGGLAGKLLTDLPGSSDYYLGGFITYSNELKTRELDVPVELMKNHGAVSAPVAEAMARGALAKTGGDWSVAITGIAGPGGGTETKPVGLVYLAVAHHRGCAEVKEFRYGDLGRQAVRTRAAYGALDLLRLAILQNGTNP